VDTVPLITLCSSCAHSSTNARSSQGVKAAKGATVNFARISRYNAQPQRCRIRLLTAGYSAPASLDTLGKIVLFARKLIAMSIVSYMQAGGTVVRV
jgi:hypothetical protein